MKNYPPGVTDATIDSQVLGGLIAIARNPVILDEALRSIGL